MHETTINLFPPSVFSVQLLDKVGYLLSQLSSLVTVLQASLKVRVRGYNNTFSGLMTIITLCSGLGSKKACNYIPSNVNSKIQCSYQILVIQ